MQAKSYFVESLKGSEYPGQAKVRGWKNPALLFCCLDISLIHHVAISAKHLLSEQLQAQVDLKLVTFCFPVEQTKS